MKKIFKLRQPIAFLLVLTLAVAVKTLFVRAAPPQLVWTGGATTDNGQSNQNITERGVQVGTSSGNYSQELADNTPASSNYGVFLQKWGSSGSGDGQFARPSRMDTDSAGNVYVLDNLNNRVQKFDSDGVYITQWGSSGNGNGQFNLPYGITVDSSGYIYVADTDNNRIQKFDSDGVYITQWGSSGNGNGQFSYPNDIVADSSNNIYVTDINNNRVQKFDNIGNYITSFGTSGNENGQFSNPTGIAVDSSSNVYVADLNNNRVQKFDNNGNFITKWGSQGGGSSQFSSPDSIGIDHSDNVYVVDRGNHRIQKFDSNGVFLDKWGEYGFDDGQLFYPNGITNDSSGNIYVSDSNNRIQEFYPSGTNINANYANFICQTEYFYRAYATNNDGTSYGAEKTFTPSCQVSAPTFVSVLDNHFNDGSTSIVQMGWDLPDNDGGNSIQYYKVQYKESDSSEWIEGVTGFTSYTMYLNSGTEYDFRVRAVTSVGDGDWSGIVTFTAEAQQPLLAPANFSAQPNVKSASLSWDSSDGASYYEAEYKLSSDNQWSPYIGNQITSTNVVIGGLQPESTYDFRVRSAADYGDRTSDWSITTNITTNQQQSYAISNCKQLQAILIDRDTFSPGDLEGSYTLQNDIDCSETNNWTWDALVPPGSGMTFKGFIPINGMGDGMKFGGTLDGQGHKIINLYQEFDVPMLGLIGAADGATIKDLILENSTMISKNPSNLGSGSDVSETPRGVLLGSGINSTIANVHVTDVNADVEDAGMISFGGLMSFGGMTNIEDSSVTGMINVHNLSNDEQSMTIVGGIAGSSMSSQLKRTYADTKVSVSGGAIESVGGLAGLAMADIENSYAVNDITVNGTQDNNMSMLAVGGLSGVLNGGINNSYSRGLVVVATPQNQSSTQDVGGLVGSTGFMGNSGTLSIHNSFSKTQLTHGNMANVGGVIGTASAANGSPNLSGTIFDVEKAGNQKCAGIVVYDNNQPTGDDLLCGMVNSDGSQNDYFINNDTNAPLNGWDFNQVWGTQVGNTPILRGNQPAEMTPPSAPQNVSTILNDDDFVLSWQAPSNSGHGEITGYQIQHRKKGENSWQIKHSASTSSTISGLDEFTEYEFRVAAVNGAGTGEFSSIITSEIVDLPGQISNLTADMGQDYVVRLNWQTPSNTGGAQNLWYKVEYREVGDDVWQLFNSHLTQTNAEIANLPPGQFDFRVSAGNARGFGLYAQISDFTVVSLLPGVPKNVTVSNFRSSQLEGLIEPVVPIPVGLPKISWQPTGGDADYFIVQYKDKTEDNWQTVSPNPSDSPLEEDFGLIDDINELYTLADIVNDEQGFNNLSPEEQAQIQDRIAELQLVFTNFLDRLSHNTTYQFRVAAVNIHGQSEFSSPIEFNWGYAPSTCEELSSTLSYLESITNQEDIDPSYHAYVSLMNDIDCSATSQSGQSWVPKSVGLTTLDGKGYAINSLYMASEYNGLFGALGLSEVKNLVFDNPTIDDGQTPNNPDTTLFASGVLAGNVISSNITNITINNASLIGSSSDGDFIRIMGGLVGTADDTTISEIDINNIAVSPSTSYLAGGLVGSTDFLNAWWGNIGGNVNISSVNVQGTITNNGSIDSTSIYGGLVGSEGFPGFLDHELPKIEISSSSSNIEFLGYCSIVTGGAIGSIGGSAKLQHLEIGGSVNCIRDDNVQSVPVVAMGGAVGTFGFGLAGQVDVGNAKLEIDNVVATNDIYINHLETPSGSGTYLYDFVGGLVGTSVPLQPVEITDSQRSGEIDIVYGEDSGSGDNSITIMNYTGGLFGGEYTSYSGTIDLPSPLVATMTVANSSTAGSINMYGYDKYSGKNYIGGAIGYATLAEMHDVAANMDINTSGLTLDMPENQPFGIISSIGGLVGSTSAIDLENTNWQGDIIGTNSGFSSAGGLIGEVVPLPVDAAISININNSRAGGTIANTSRIGGLMGSPYLHGLAPSGFGGTKVDINSSSFTGQLLNNFDSESLPGNESSMFALMTSGSGGLVGYGGGSLSATLLGSGSDSEPTIREMNINNSSAIAQIEPIDSDSVTSLSSGGLIGSSSNAHIQKSYFSGGVEGVAAGGLIGNSWMDEVSNSYSRGNVRSAALNGNIFGGSSGMSGVTFNGSGGGLIGVSYGSRITNSYASGRITGSPKSEVPQGIFSPGAESEGISEESALSFMEESVSESKLGGLVGTYNFGDEGSAVSGTSLPPVDITGSIKNSFSTAQIDTSHQSSFRGSSVGLLSPGAVTMGFMMYPAPSSTNGIQLFENNYYDSSLAGYRSCGVNATFTGESDPITSMGTQISEINTGGCQIVNSDGKVQGYYVNNTTRPPLDTWDFTNVWRTNVADLPDFIGSQGPPINDDHQNPNDPPTPNNPEINQNPKVPSTIDDPTGNDGGKPTDSSHKSFWPNKNKPPEDLTKAPKRHKTALDNFFRFLPFALIILILAICALYSYVALKEKKRQDAIKQMLDKTRKMKISQRNFVNGVTHYLNTPISKLAGAIELMYSSGVLSVEEQATGKELLSSLKSQVTLILQSASMESASQVQSDFAVSNMRPTNKISQPIYWAPAVVALAILSISNYSYVYVLDNKLPLATFLIQLALTIVALLAFGAIYFYWKKTKIQRIDLELLLADENNQNTKRTSFIYNTLSTLSNHGRQLESFSNNVRELEYGKNFEQATIELDYLFQRFYKASEALNTPVGLSKTPASINNAGSQIMDKFSPEIVSKSIKVVSQVPENSFARIKPDDLSFVLHAVMKNAVEFTPNGKNITISSNFIKDKIKISIQDSGGGVDSKLLPQIFDPFTHLDDLYTMDRPSIGLDMFTAKQIVENNLGSITATNFAEGLRVDIELQR